VSGPDDGPMPSTRRRPCRTIPDGSEALLDRARFPAPPLVLKWTAARRDSNSDRMKNAMEAG
ncbi:MAG: hypothetical protein Q7O66_10860, partial [Dehalococcoidia bacterium]|nr:hypothetical protein [Dehalococcoidia bacterium]